MPATPEDQTATVPRSGLRHGLFPRNPLRHLHVSDLRGLARLATQAGLEGARVAEALAAGWGPVLRDAAGTTPAEPAVPPRQDPRLDRGMRPYSGLQGFVRLSGQGIDALLAGVEPLVEIATRPQAETVERAAVLAMLNALAGDRLAADKNPLATGMQLRHRGELLRNHRLPAPPAPGGRVLLLVHGWGMTESVWQGSVGSRRTGTAQDGEGPPPPHGMGEALAAALGSTVLHLRYNSGRPVADNGRELAALLEQLLTHASMPVTELAIVAHGMGGLVARAAVHLARQQATWHWPRLLRQLVFLGTPHHGQGPQAVRRHRALPRPDGPAVPGPELLQRLTGLRSAGLQDLQRGAVLGAEALSPPLPEGIACYTVAGSLSRQRHALLERTLGDGVVPVASALGQHADPQRSLVFARGAQHVASRTHHLHLPRSTEVARRIIDWLQPG